MYDKLHSNEARVPEVEDNQSEKFDSGQHHGIGNLCNKMYIVALSQCLSVHVTCAITLNSL